MEENMALRGLKIREPHVGFILDGLKTWEIRGTATKIRGPIALVKAGTPTIVGTCELRGVEGPLSTEDLRRNAKKLNAKPSDIENPPYYGDHTYAWVLGNVRRLKKPVPYDPHPGSVIWVTLDDKLGPKIGL
jgi:hypothetical protein